MSEPSKLVIAGAAYHVNAGTLRTVVEQRDALLTALQACLTAITVTPRSEMDCFTWSRLADKARAAIAACEVQS